MSRDSYLNKSWKECPIHNCKARKTDWLPRKRLDPLLREYRCVKGHALYCVEEIKEAQVSYDIKELKTTQACMICGQTIESVSIEEHTRREHTTQQKA